MKCLVRELKNIARDEFGPEHVYEVFHTSTGDPVGWVVIDNTVRSPTRTGKGGTAMYPDCNLDITRRKARVMTWKQVFCSPLGEKPTYTPWGGAKGGIKGSYARPHGKEILCGWGRALYDAGIMPQQYVFGLDVGLKGDAVRALVEALDNNRLVSTAKPEDMGGIPYEELGITGLGLLESLKVLCEYTDVDFTSPRTTIAIQGFGAVGMGFMKWLGTHNSCMRPRVVAISDVGGSVYLERGFHPEISISLASQQKTIAHYPSAEARPLGSELLANVDILVLAAKEDQISEANMRDIKAKIILQGANMGVSEIAESYLHTQGKITLPDFVSNAGAATIALPEYAGDGTKKGIAYVKKVLAHNSRLILEEMRRSKRSPRAIAQAIAEAEVRKHM